MVVVWGLSVDVRARYSKDDCTFSRKPRSARHHSLALGVPSPCGQCERFEVCRMGIEFAVVEQAIRSLVSTCRLL